MSDAAALARLFPGDSDMARRMRAFDWETTALGSPVRWPQGLRSAVRIMLTSRYAMWMGWGPGLTFFYNDAYARMTLGAKHPWALGRRADEVWAEIWDDIGPLIDHVFATGEATWNEAMMLLLGRSGYSEETYHTFSYSPLTDDDGATAGMFCVVTEETERVIGERRLGTLADLSGRLAVERREKRTLRTIGRAFAKADRDLPFAMLCLFDLRGVPYVAASSAAAGEDGMPAFAAGFDWQALLATRPSVQTASRLAPSSGTSLPTGSWSASPIEVAVVPIAAQGRDAALGYVIAGLNPHRRHDDGYARFLDLIAGQISAGLASARAYDEERRRAAALAEIDRAKTAFFANVSHEFRTPLTLMISPLEQVLASPPAALGADQRDLLDVAWRNSGRLLKLVNSLLDFTRIEAGRSVVSFEPVDLSCSTAELASNFRSIVERAGLRLDIDCPPLPEPVHVDRDMWEKIVLNLLSNAFKFTFEGSIGVSVGVSPEGTGAVLTIRDTGVGIAAQELPRLFERFHRIEGQRSRSFEGSGIGLALVRELVKQHGGTVDADSRSGAGTTFRVAVPFGKDHLPPDRIGAARAAMSTALRIDAVIDEAASWLPDAGASTPRPAADARSARRAAGPLARVLIADDNADMRAYLSRLLQDDYEVATVADGEAALQAIADRVPDLLLSDVMMPGLDGFGLLKRLRADPRTKSLPILLLSARAGEDARIEGLRTGADDYLTKPFSARELVARVESNLKLAEVRREQEARVNGILDSMTDGFLMVDSAGRFTQINAAARRMFEAQGMDADAALGKTLGEAFVGGETSEGGAALRQAMATRQPQSLEAFYEPWNRWHDVRHYPTPDGGVATFFQDITERKRLEEKRSLLTNELNHRVKNMLAVIQAIANQTLRDTPDPKAFRDAFSDRLTALSRAHDLLTRQVWQGVDLGELVATALKAFSASDGERRLRWQGPSITVPPNVAVSLTMALHELATNASKYGALTLPDGRVHLRWTVRSDEPEAGAPRIEIDWRERGGPPVAPPTKRGFGRRVIESSVSQLGGSVDLDFPLEGARCLIVIPAIH